MYEYLLESKQPIQYYNIFGHIGDVLFEADNVIKGSVSVSNQCSDSNEFRLGGCYIGQLNISFINVNIPRNDWIGKPVNLAVQIGNESIPLGIYYIDQAKHSKNIVSCVCYDNMARFDKACGTQDGTFGTAFSLLNLACERCGVEFSMSQAEIEALPNGTQPFVLLEMGDIETWRDFIYWISVSLASFATIDRFGRLVLRKFHDSVDDTIDSDVRYATSTYGDEIITYTGVNVYVTEDRSVKYYHAETDDGYTLNIGNNPFFQVGEVQRDHYIENILSALAEISFNACSVSIPFGFHYDLGDVLSFPNGQGSSTNLFCIMGFSFKYNGECQLKGIPGQKSTSSKSDKNLQGMLSTVSKNEFTSYEIRNADPISISDEETERLVQARIASNTNTKAQIHVEVNLETEMLEGEDFTRGVVSYLVNSEDVNFYPMETWIDGNHIMHLMYILPLEANSIQTFDVYLTADGGQISIDRGGVWLYASGAGLVGDGKWDGKVEVDDDAEDWIIPMIEFEDLSDSVSISAQAPEAAAISDSVSDWSILSIEFENVTDSATVTVRTNSFGRILEDGSVRITENNNIRITEGD